MIQEVYLFTNRNMIVFDESNEQVHSVSDAITWSHHSYDRHTEKDALRIIIKDDPIIYLARWQDHTSLMITPDELCSILGYGPWYWHNYKEEAYNDKLEDEDD